jgi:acetolactate synthase-1/2/3 large subunit
VDLFHRISKWSDRVATPDLMGSVLAKAFRVALSGRPGPVFLELAWDVLSNGADNEALPSQYRTRARQPPDPHLLEEAAALLDRAQRPAVIAGSSVWWDDAAPALDALARKAGLPVFLNGAGRGSLPYGHPHFFQLSRKEALSAADVVLVVGTPFDFRLNYGGEPTFSAETRIVQVDIDPTEVGRNRAVEVGLVADSRSALQALEAAVTRKDRSARLAELRAAEAAKVEKQRAFERSDQKPVHHFRLARELSDAANAAGDPMWIADGGNWVAIAAKVIELKGPGRWLDPGPLGCLGVGAPFAVAAKTLYPQRPVVVIQGDGSFGLNGFDFETALRFKLPMVCVVGNDAAWGQIRLPQVQMFGEDKSPATLLAPTRYDKVVEAFGGHGEFVTEPSQIRPALDRAFASGTVACVNVMLDPDAPASSGSQGYAV